MKGPRLYIILITGCCLAYFSFSRLLYEGETLSTDPTDLNQLQLNVLLYCKANAWVHTDAIAAAKEVFPELAKQQDWKLTISDDPTLFTTHQLEKYDVLVWSNVTGRTLDDDQRAAFKDYIETGGGFVGIHGTGDNSHDWDWYYDELIRAVFSHHPMEPQFQVGTLTRECPSNFKACESLPSQWEWEEEWYVFEESPRNKGAAIIYTLDETNMVIHADSKGTEKHKDKGMGDDHPIVWFNCVGEGKAFYSALGHKGTYYHDPVHQKLLIKAIEWAGDHNQKCN
ncbi:MAG: ThuA domain-containing protein [Flavobacteriaceae bacterium]